MKKTLQYECDVCDLCQNEEAGGSYECRLCGCDICYTCRDSDAVTVLADNSELQLIGEYCRNNIVYCNKCVTKLDDFDDSIPLLDGTAYYDLKTLLADIKDLQAENKVRIKKLKQRYDVIKIMLNVAKNKKATLCEQEKAPHPEKLISEKLPVPSLSTHYVLNDDEKEVSHHDIGNAGYYIQLPNGERKFALYDGVQCSGVFLKSDIEEIESGLAATKSFEETKKDFYETKPEPKGSSRTSWCDQRELGS